MSFRPGHIPASLGKVTTTEPIRDLETVAKIRSILSNDVRQTALFSVALNSGLRASDLCALEWCDIQDDDTTCTLRVIERKTKKVRFIPLNNRTSSELRAWRDQSIFDKVYSGQRGGYTVGSYSRLVKDWLAAVGMTEHTGSHSLRKSFVRLQHDFLGTSITTLMSMLNHSTPTQTLKYMGRMSDDIMVAYNQSL